VIGFLFEKLRSAFGSLSKLATHTSISEKDLESILWEFELALIESDVAQEVIQAIISNLRQKLVGQKIQRGEDQTILVKNKLKDAIKETFSKTPTIDLEGLVKSKLASNTGDSFSPFVILFLGINGVGKTTTIAKLAYLFKNKGISVLLAAGDTHRAGAIEQLTEHASRLKVKAIAQSYGSDPAAVAKDALLYAESHKVAVVLIDSAGRIQTSRNLMEEMEKIVRVVRPDLKIFVADSLAGNDAVSQAKEFKNFTDFNATILTKADADTKGGAALSIAFITQRPIIYLTVGQEYQDLVPFNVEEFVENVLT
jgi:fused signal recognition particle receptor